MDIGQFLRVHREVLVGRWKDKLRAALYRDSTLTDQQLLDSMQVFVDQVIDGLDRQSGPLVDEQRSAIAGEHGSERQQLRQDLYNLVREYGHFLDCLGEVAEKEGIQLEVSGVFALSRLLNAGAAAAAHEFAKRAELEREAINAQHFAFLAHELRNPLSSARLAWELLRRPAASAQPTAAAMVTRSLAKLSELIDHALTEVRLRSIDGGALPLHREQCLVSELLEVTVEESMIDAQTKQLSISIEADRNLTIDADPRLIRSAASNLLRNAIKFSRPRGKLVLRARHEQGRVLLEVEDDCGGVPADQAERIFDAFSQVGADRSGFGLGLAITKHAIEAHGGTVTLKNAPPKGCVFVVDLPAAPV
jgi:signal transduction histidine kinase